MTMMRKVISAAAMVAMCLTAQGQMRVEPANWWVGMKNPEVQLMIHDKGVAKMEASVDAKGVEVTRVERTDNPNYMFVTLSISKKAKAGTFDINLEGESGEKTIKYELKERRPNSQFRTGFSSDDAI